MKRVYVAGPYSGPDIITVLGNMRKGLKLSVRVLEAGMAPFAPWLDYLYSFLADISLDRYYKYSLAWLEASDAMLVQVEGAAASEGTQEEILRAIELRIPVFYNFDDLEKWKNEQS
jgi:hypothetical protein